MKTFLILLTYFICYIPTLVFFAATPYITRKTESFGVSIPEEVYHSTEIKNIREVYRNSILGFGGVLAVFALFTTFLVPEEIAVTFLGVGTLIQLALMFTFYIVGHKKMKALKASSNWTANKPQMVVVDTTFRNKKIIVSPLWFLLYAVIILATFIFGVLMYDRLPDKLPMHWNINLEIDNVVDKSYKVLFFVPAVQIFMMLIMMFVYWMTGKAKQQIDASNPEKSIEQSRIFRYRWSAFTVFGGLIMMLVFGIMQLSIMGFITNPLIIVGAPLILGGGLVVGSIVLSFTTGQGGSRVNTVQGKSGEAVNRDEDKYWKLGMFYYNPDDPAIFVEKRFGVGWTNNFARPMSWLMIIGLVVFLGIFIWGISFLTAK